MLCTVKIKICKLSRGREQREHPWGPSCSPAELFDVSCSLVMWPWNLTENGCSKRSLMTLLGYSEMDRVKMGMVSTKSHSHMATWNKAPQSLPRNVRHEKWVSRVWPMSEGKRLSVQDSLPNLNEWELSQALWTAHLLILNGKSSRKLQSGWMKLLEQTVKIQQCLTGILTSEQDIRD